MLVISPLVSLMMDQCKALNAKKGVDVACFLGSAQHDFSVEQKAKQGHYRLVYATPEKALGFKLSSEFERFTPHCCGRGALRERVGPRF